MGGEIRFNKAEAAAVTKESESGPKETTAQLNNIPYYTYIHVPNCPTILFPLSLSPQSLQKYA